MELLAGAFVGGKYELERALASGGMGSIWVARHTELCCKIAIKFISAAYAGSPSLRARFVREARAAAQIVSNNVVRVHDYGVEDDTPYLVMELLHGEDLGARLKRERRLPLSVVAGLFTQIARGLRRAHKAGFVHRDLKPSNIFLARSGDDDDEEEVVKLLDFGVAKETDAARGGPAEPPEEHTKTGEIMGSPHYMSPEQIHESKDIDARSDLWSLAVILFRAITGELPFPGEAAGPVMSKILTDPIPIPSHYASGLPREVDEFFWKAFQRDPDQRFQSAREMAEAFAQAAGAVPTRLSWTYLGTSIPLRRLADAVPQPSCPTLSSTVPAPGAASPGEALSLDEAARPSDTLPAEPPAPTALTAPAAPDEEDLPCASGTLSASSLAVIGSPRSGHRPILGWTIAVAGATGIALGWFIVGFLLNPIHVAPAKQEQAAPLAAVAPLSPAFSVPAPTEVPSSDLDEPPPDPNATSAKPGAPPPKASAAPAMTSPSAAPWTPAAPRPSSWPADRSPYSSLPKKTPRLGF